MFRLQGLAAVAVLVSFAGASVSDDKEKEKEKEAEANKKALKALEGNWQLTREEMRGSLTPKPVVQRLRIVIEGDEMAWYIGNPASNQTANLKVDVKPEIKTIDAEITKGSAKDKKMLGIYKLTKDTLEICWGEPGSDKRPTKFTSRPGVGAGNTMCTYEREKEKDK